MKHYTTALVWTDLAALPALGLAPGLQLGAAHLLDGGAAPLDRLLPRLVPAPIRGEHGVT